MDSLKKGLEFYKDIKTLYDEGKNIKEIYQKLTSVSVQSKKDLIENFLMNKIDYKDHVKIRGSLLDYGHLYKPESYINSIEKNDIDSSEERSPEGAKLVLSMSWKPFQLPVSRIPSVQAEDEILSLAFLYPLEFENFIYEGIDAFVGGPLSEPTFTIPKSAKPIPVLMRQEDVAKYKFKRIELTARVVPLPSQLVTRLTDNPFSFIQFSEAINPINEKMPSLSLKANTNKSQIKVLKKEEPITQCNASIFMETHLEGRDGDISKELIRRIPQISSKALTGRQDSYSLTKEDNIDSKSKQIFQLHSNSGLTIIGKHPNVLGFYFEENIVNLQEPYTHFIKEFNSFTENIYDIAPDLTMHIDFMHDYQLKNYFNTPLLNSESCNYIKDERLVDTMHWLRE